MGKFYVEGGAQIVVSAPAANNCSTSQELAQPSSAIAKVISEIVNYQFNENFDQEIVLRESINDIDLTPPTHLF